MPDVSGVRQHCVMTIPDPTPAATSSQPAATISEKYTDDPPSDPGCSADVESSPCRVPHEEEFDASNNTLIVRPKLIITSSSNVSTDFNSAKGLVDVAFPCTGVLCPVTNTYISTWRFCVGEPCRLDNEPLFSIDGACASFRLCLAADHSRDSPAPHVQSTSAQTTEEYLVVCGKEVDDTLEKAIFEWLPRRGSIETQDGDTVTARLRRSNNICSVNVGFRPQNLVITFNTSDREFLSRWQKTPATTFEWRPELFDAVEPERCKKYNTETGSYIDLHKAHPDTGSSAQPWISLLSQMEFSVAIPMPPPPPPVSSDQKPTCVVSPHQKVQRDELVTPGATGLRNIGNTCFLNSVVQVLSNTLELREFFTQDFYCNDVNHKNVLGMRGRLANTFATLLKTLWSGRHRYAEPHDLKHLVASKATQFANYAQHDAQEFLSFLLDGLHEDLNRVEDKPLTAVVESNGRPDDVVAAEAWAAHQARNNSVIVELFHGQFKSRLECPNCSRVSITFDPVLYLTLPFPPSQRRIKVYCFPAAASAKPILVEPLLLENSSVADLQRWIAGVMGVARSELIRLADVFHKKVFRFYEPQDAISTIAQNDVTFAFECLDPLTVGGAVANCIVLQRLLLPENYVPRCEQNGCTSLGPFPHKCTHCLRVYYCSTDCMESDADMHLDICHSRGQSSRGGFGAAQPGDLCGQPFMLSLPAAQTSKSRLEEMIEQRSRYVLDVFLFPQQSDGSSSGQTTQSPLSSDDAGYASAAGDAEALQLRTTEGLSEDGDADSTTAEPAQDLSDDLQMIEVLEDADEVQPGMAPWGGQSGTPDPPEPIYGPMEENEGWRDGGFGKGFGKGVPSSHPSSWQRSEEDQDSTEHPSDPDQNSFSRVRVVIGEHREKQVAAVPLFIISPTNKEGHRMRFKDEKVTKQEDGETLYDLEDLHYLAVDWLNFKDGRRHLSIETKEPHTMEYTRHESSLEDENFGSAQLELHELLSRFVETEVLSAQEAWYCSQCKEHVQATKTLNLWKLPPLLIIQLKRFQYTNNSVRHKIDRPVTYPLRGLDLQPYLCSAAPRGSTTYDLYGVVCHSGTTFFGHYVSYAKCDSETGWRLFDDNNVSDVPHEQSAVTNHAYLLFYRRSDHLPSNYIRKFPPFDPTAVHDDTVAAVVPSGSSSGSAVVPSGSPFGSAAIPSGSSDTSAAVPSSPSPFHRSSSPPPEDPPAGSSTMDDDVIQPSTSSSGLGDATPSDGTSTIGSTASTVTPTIDDVEPEDPCPVQPSSPPMTQLVDVFGKFASVEVEEGDASDAILDMINDKMNNQ